MTAKSDPAPLVQKPPTAAAEASNLLIWFAKPDVGPEHILMVLVDDPDHGVTYRPLMFLDEVTAESQRHLAQEAATALGVTAVLREYEARSLLDHAEPQA